MAGRPVVGRVRPRRALRRADPRCLPGRWTSVREGDQRLERQPDGARRDARPRRFRGCRVPGPARARTSPDQRPAHPDGAVARPGAGAGDGCGSFAAGSGLRTVADRAAAGGTVAGVPGRAAFQRPDLHARLRPHAGAARARLCAPDGGECRDRQGSEDIRPQSLADRALPSAGRWLLCHQPPAGAEAGGLGEPVRPSARSATTWPMPTSSGAP